LETSALLGVPSGKRVIFAARGDHRAVGRACQGADDGQFPRVWFQRPPRIGQGGLLLRPGARAEDQREQRNSFQQLERI
jgi:hypothetical protein